MDIILFMLFGCSGNKLIKTVVFTFILFYSSRHAFAYYCQDSINNIREEISRKQITMDIIGDNEYRKWFLRDLIYRGNDANKKEQIWNDIFENIKQYRKNKNLILSFLTAEKSKIFLHSNYTFEIKISLEIINSEMLEIKIRNVRAWNSEGKQKTIGESIFTNMLKTVFAGSIENILSNPDIKILSIVGYDVKNDKIAAIMEKMGFEQTGELRPIAVRAYYCSAYSTNRTAPEVYRQYSLKVRIRE
jgi:hypothetical protein